MPDFRQRHRMVQGYGPCSISCSRRGIRRSTPGQGTACRAAAAERKDAMASVRLTLLTVACVTGVALVTAVAQPAQGMRQGAPMYDTKSEGTFTGTVEAVENVTPAGAGR